MAPEIFFEMDDVHVAPYVAQIGGPFFQIGRISSVRARQTKRLSRVAVFVFLLGVVLFVAAILSSSSEEQAEANFPLAVTAVGVIIFSFLVQLVLPRRVFKLILRTHGGDVEVL